MTDVLFERFSALAEPGDGDWSEVRRRARRARLRVAVPAAAAAAAIVAAAALAATGGWVFSTRDRHVTAKTQITLAGRTYHVSMSTRGAGRLCFDVSASGAATSVGCRGSGGQPRLGPPFGGLRLDVPGGQIWMGATVGFARRISITDVSGRVHSTQTIAAPHGTKTPFRYWAIALAGTKARSITAYDAKGRRITTGVK